MRIEKVNLNDNNNNTGYSQSPTYTRTHIAQVYNPMNIQRNFISVEPSLTHWI